MQDDDLVRRDTALLIAATFLFPVYVALLFLPSPSVDIREHVNWGLYFPLFTWKHPPFEDWVAGTVALTGARDGWVYVLVAQLFTLGALGYLALIAGRFVGRHTVLPVIIAFCGCIFNSVATPISALNADQLQVVMWLGLLYHGLAALRDDRWRDWILAGIFAALAILTKYFAVVLVAAFVISALAGSWRRGMMRPGLAAAVAVCLGIVALHLVPLLIHMGSDGSLMQYGESQFNLQAGLRDRLNSFVQLGWSFIAFGLPFLVVLAVVGWRGDSIVLRPVRDAGFTIIALTLALVVAALVIMILAGGLAYRPRFSNPIMPLALLVGFGCLSISPVDTHQFARGMLVFYALVFVGSVGLLSGLGDNYLRDPLPAAADHIRRDWNSRYSCGPAYVIGGNEITTAPGAHGVGMYYGGSVRGLSHSDYRLAQWVDHERARDLGAIIVETPRSLAQSSEVALFPDMTPQAEITLPFRRSLGPWTQTYLYRFVAPQRCPTKR